MFRFTLILITASALAFGCTSKSSGPSEDPFDTKLELPPTKPLDSAHTSQAKQMWTSINGVMNGVGMLDNSNTPIRPTDVIEDSIVNNCKLVADESRSGSKVRVESHTESLNGRTCPVMAQGLTESSTRKESENSIRATARSQQQLSIVADPLLSLVDLRNLVIQGALVLGLDLSANGNRLRVVYNGSGSVTFSSLGNLEFFQKVRSDVVTSSMSGEPQSGKTVVAAGVFVSNQWYVLKVEMLYSNGQATHTCSLNGVDFSGDPACSGTSLMRRLDPSALSVYER